METTVFHEPKCLINAEGGGFSINEDTLNEIGTLEKTLNAVAITGLYRTGKSYILTRLARQKKGFPLGKSTVAKTKGIWAWCVDHPTKKDQALLLLDTEGLGDIKKVSVVLGLVKNIKGSDKDGEESDLGQFLPEFILVLRDFTLELEKDGEEINANEYLEDCLSTLDENAEGAEAYNEPRLLLRKFFDERTCFTMPIPGTKKKLAILENTSDDELDEDFIIDLHKFLSYVWDKTKPFKTKNDYGINGRMYTTLVRSYMQAIVNGAIPCIDKTMKDMARNENLAIVNEAFSKYKNDMEDVKLPTLSEDDLTNLHITASDESLDFFLKKSLKDEDGEAAGRLKEMVEGQYSRIKEKNRELSQEQCKTQLRKLHENIATKFKAGVYLCEGGFATYQEDVEEMKKTYRTRENIGFMKEAVLVAFMEEIKDDAEAVLKADTLFKTEAEKRQKLAEEARKREEESKKQAEEERARAAKEFEKFKEEMMKSQAQVLEKAMKDFEMERRNFEEHRRRQEEESMRLRREGHDGMATVLVEQNRQLMMQLQREREHQQGGCSIQ